jgi:hypothetical protein
MRRYLNETFRPFDVPFDAKYVGTVEIGSNIGPGLGLEVALWEEQTEGKSMNSIISCHREKNSYRLIFGTITFTACIP